MTYLALARRYRPTQFDGPAGLLGQPHVAQTLKNALRSGRLANAYLLAGPRGTGKTTSARILAAALNCPQPADTEPCGQCDVCRRILHGKDTVDVVEIDAASNRGAADARALVQQAQYAPSTERGTKVYIIDEAHMLTREAWNALLKVLEEPPPRVVFALATTEPQKIEDAADPVMSRVQRFDFKRIALPDIVERLAAIADAEQITITREALALVARRADGGMRDALSLLDQLCVYAGAGTAIAASHVRAIFGTQPEKVLLGVLDLVIDSLPAAAPKGDEPRKRIFKLVAHLEQEGADTARFLDDWYDTLAALLLVAQGGTPEEWSPAGVQELGRRTPRVPSALVVQLMAQALADAQLIRHSPRPSALLLTALQTAVSRAAAWGAP